MLPPSPLSHPPTPHLPYTTITPPPIHHHHPTSHTPPSPHLPYTTITPPPIHHHHPTSHTPPSPHLPYTTITPPPIHHHHPTITPPPIHHHHHTPNLSKAHRFPCGTWSSNLPIEANRTQIPIISRHPRGARGSLGPLQKIWGGRK